MFGSGRDTLPDVPEGWEALPNVQELSGDPSGCQGVVRRPSQMSRSGRETLPDVREW